MTSDQKQSWMKVQPLAVARLLCTPNTLNLRDYTEYRSKLVNRFILGVKVHLSSTAHTKLERIIVAVVLVLALLSGVVPLGSAAAGHLCAMECCAALPPHAAGSCHMSMASHESEPQQDLNEHCGLPEANNGATDGIVAGVMGMTTSTQSSADLDDVTIDASDHCKTDSQSKDLNAPSLTDYPESASIATESFSKPCPPECGTGALSSGVRRSRDSAALADQGHSRPLMPGRKTQHFNDNFLINSTYCRQLRPRGPPSSFN